MESPSTLPAPPEAGPKDHVGEFVSVMKPALGRLNRSLEKRIAELLKSGFTPEDLLGAYEKRTR